VLYFAAIMFITEMLVASRYGFHADELYFLACSEHLAWGYIDQPPLIVFIAFAHRGDGPTRRCLEMQVR
jgi:hypothetical protein